MASVLLVACESDAGAWPPVAALSRELAQQGHIVRQAPEPARWFGLGLARGRSYHALRVAARQLASGSNNTPAG